MKKTTKNAGKDKIINKQVEGKGYKITEIEKDDTSNKYSITLTDNQGNIHTFSVSSETMQTELFHVGDIVFMNENGTIEQAFDKDDK